MTRIDFISFPLWDIGDKDPYGTSEDVLFDLERFDWAAHGLRGSEERAWGIMAKRLGLYLEPLRETWIAIANALPALQLLTFSSKAIIYSREDAAYLEIEFKRDTDGKLADNGLVYGVKPL